MIYISCNYYLNESKFKTVQFHKNGTRGTFRRKWAAYF